MLLLVEYLLAMTGTALAFLHEEIDRCRMCDKRVSGFAKPSHLERGDIGRVMIIGQGPGKAELRRSRAFAGQSGKTLDSWLKSAGASENNPRAGIYFTSVIKCCHELQRDFALMAHNCAPFLQRQIQIIQPKLVITLGVQAYEHLKFAPLDFESALCTPVHTSEYLLISQLQFGFWLLPWPHPSGLNRWHNSAENRARLEASFGFVRQALEGNIEAK